MTIRKKKEMCEERVLRERKTW